MAREESVIEQVRMATCEVLDDKETSDTRKITILLADLDILLAGILDALLMEEDE